MHSDLVKDAYFGGHPFMYSKSTDRCLTLPNFLKLQIAAF